MTPADENQLADAIATAKGTLCVQGGGTHGLNPNGVTTISTSGLADVTLYEPGALTIVAQAGTPVGVINEMLATQGQRLAFEPMDHRALLGTKGTPTIGGVVAANVSGPRRIQLGACRDFLLGVRFVDGRGRIIKNGGRVMKNVTGYDLSKLLAGSHGTLGVLTEVALKVLPKPEVSASICVPGLAVAKAVRAMSSALGSPFDISGAAHFAGSTPMTVIRLEGFEKSVSYRAGRISNLLSEFGDVVVENDDKSRAIWDQVRDVEPFHGRVGDVWKISVKPTDAPDIVSRIQADGVLFDWGGGLIWVLVPNGTDLRGQIGAFRGHATLVRADKKTHQHIPTFQPETGTMAQISIGIRREFDPKGILNSGLMGN